MAIQSHSQDTKPNSEVQSASQMTYKVIFTNEPNFQSDPGKFLFLTNT